jgi:hypothetical protein
MVLISTRNGSFRTVLLISLYYRLVPKRQTVTTPSAEKEKDFVIFPDRQAVEVI